MSLAREYLRDYIERASPSQAEFARAAGMTAPNLSDVLNGSVEISARNLPKILRGFADDSERIEFLATYLRDEVPAEFARSIDIQIKAESGGVREASTEDPLTHLITQFPKLPSKKLRAAVLLAVDHLLIDAEFRQLFLLTMSYLEPLTKPTRAPRQ